TLDRGRVVVASRRKEPAKVRARFRGTAFELTLHGGGTEVALELFSQWPPGIPFIRKKADAAGEAVPELAPVTTVVCVLLKGEAVRGDGAEARRGAVYGLAAVDDLPPVGEALADEKHADTRRSAVEALRLWVARGPDEDMRLYELLVKGHEYSPAQAETVLQLLHSFSLEQIGQRDVYETLVNYLTSTRLAVRELARWHLERLAPAAGIDFD